MACFVSLAFVLACGSPSPTVESSDVAPASATAMPGWRLIDIPGMRSGLRAASYDQSRNCLWILNRFFDDVGTPVVALTRLDLATGSSVATSIAVSAIGYIRGSIAVDASGKIWMGWGTTLSRYDPEANSMESWTRPTLLGLVVQPFDVAMDGNMVALAIAGDNEVWVAFQSVQALFGFNPVAKSWDRIVKIPIAAGMRSKLSIPQASVLTLNGMRYSGAEPTFALVVVSSTGVVTSLVPHILGYVTLGGTKAVYVDDGDNLGKVDLLSGGTATVATHPPVAKTAELVGDSAGRVWFAAEGYKMVGVGRLDLTTNAITIFALPTVTAGSGPVPACGAAQCVPPDAVFDPGIQAITIDGLNNLWVTTKVGGTSNGVPKPVISPVLELLATP